MVAPLIMSKIIGIIGTRRRHSITDLELVKEAFFKIYTLGDSIVSGGCPKGGDYFAEVIARENKIPIKIYKADWSTYGRSAGFQRNIYIANDADILIAVVSSDRTGGTEDTIKKYLKQNKNQLILV